jgi:hypothetical protein
LYAGETVTYGWKGKIYDNNSAEVQGCGTEYEIHDSLEDYGINCDAIKGKVNVHVTAHDILEFLFGDQNWKLDDQNVCQIEHSWGITPGTGKSVSLALVFLKGFLLTGATGSHAELCILVQLVPSLISLAEFYIYVVLVVLDFAIVYCWT